MPVQQFPRAGARGPYRAAPTGGPPRTLRPAVPACPIGFALFVLVNAVLFIRPAEIVPSLEDLPVYELLIVACLLASLPAVLWQLSGTVLTANPISVCVLGLLAAVPLSHLTNLSMYGARMATFEFAKVVIYYFLCVGLLSTPARLRGFLVCLVGFITVLAGLALLQFHGVIDIPALEAIEQTDHDEETGELIVFYRLCSTGIYNDPNDLCLILVAGIVLCLYWLCSAQARLTWRLAVLPLLGMFGYALSVTQSRGGFIALLTALLVLFRARFSWWKTLPLAALGLPVMFLVFAGRQTDLNTGSSDTMQERVRLWSEGIQLFREAPLFGIGCREYAEQVGQVAHNSFMHSYTELGFFGGTWFVGAFFCAVVALSRLGRSPGPGVEPGLMWLRPYVLTIVAAYAAGMFSLSRAYIVPTYMVLGLANAHVQIASARRPAPVLRFDGRLGLTLLGVSAASLIGLYIFVRVFAQYG